MAKIILQDWKVELMKKWSPRFIIKTHYNPITYKPTFLLIDTKHSKEWQFTTSLGDNLPQRIEQHIEMVILEERNNKIDKIIKSKTK